MRMKLYGRTSVDADLQAPVEPTGSVAQGVPSVVSRIDEALPRFTGRHNVAATEVVDLLLDLRLLVVLDATLFDLFDPPE